MTSGSSGAGPQYMPEGDDVAADVADRLRFEALFSDLAADFINLEPEQVDQAIEDCLRRIVEALGLDRSTLFQRSGGDLVATHSWAVPGQQRVPTLVGRTDIPWAIEQILAGKSIVFSRLDDLPPEAAIDKELIKRFGLRSNASLPLIAGGKVIGALAVGSMRRERTWTPAVLARLRLVAHTVGAVLARRETDRQLRAALAENEQLRSRLERENRYLREQARSTAGGSQLVGQGPAMQRVLSLVERVAPTDAPVLLLGETGVGKELVAEEIHAGSARANRTLVKVNCAALAPALIEGELFGREKGAYTGALNAQIGRFELAHGSTLFRKLPRQGHTA
jgi:transcriptional regulator with GAF, ATPase, and Fis domain